jgi:hypothetical protein
LFSAGSPLGERRLGEDVPTTFEELTVGTLVRDQPRIPGCLRTDTVREVGAGPWCRDIYYLVRSIPWTIPQLFQNMPPRPLEPGASFSFELTGNRGAALVTKYSTYREDSLLESVFERYTKRHYASWVAFARHKLLWRRRPARSRIRFRYDQGFCNGRVFDSGALLSNPT